MQKHSATIKDRDVILWVNIALFGIVSMLVFYYVMIANTVTAKSYKIQTLQNKVESLVEMNSSLMSQKIVTENRSVLLDFAKSINLVEARNIVYIFENKNVAQR